MTCEVCGKPITGNGRFCSSCGAPVKMRALEETVAMIEEEEETMAPVQNRGNEATGSYRMNASDLQEETRQTYGSQDRRSYGDQGRESYGSRDRQPYGDQNRQSYSSQSRQSYGDSDRQPYSSQSRQSYGDYDRQPYSSQSRQSYGDSDRQPYSSQSRQSYGDYDRQPYSSQSRQSYGDSDRQPYSSQSRQSYGYDDSEPYYYDNTAQKPEKKSPNWLFPVLLVVCVLLLGVIVYQIVDLIRIKADASEVNVPNVSIKGDNAEEETDEDTVVAASSQEE